MPFPFAAALPIAGGIIGGILGGKGDKTDIGKEGQGYRKWYMDQLQKQSGTPYQFYGVDGYQTGGVGGKFAPPPTFGPGEDPWVAGLGGLWGEDGYVNQFMNPYQQHMEEAMGRSFGRQRDALGRQVADYATREKAFGGTRSVVAQRLGERDLNESETEAMARLNYQGYNDSLGYGLQERGIQQGQRQNEIDAARQRFEFAQNYPQMALDRFGQGFSSMPWGQQSGGGIGGAIQGAIGGAAAGYGMSGMFGRGTPTSAPVSTGWERWDEWKPKPFGTNFQPAGMTQQPLRFGGFD